MLCAVYCYQRVSFITEFLLNILMHLKEHLHPRFAFCYSLSTDSARITGLLSYLQKPNVLLGNSFVENPCGLAAALVPSSRQNQWNSDPEVQGKGFLARGWGTSFWMFTVFDMTELFWGNHLSYTVPSPAAYPFAPAEKKSSASLSCSD